MLAFALGKKEQKRDAEERTHERTKKESHEDDDIIIGTGK